MGWDLRIRNTQSHDNIDLILCYCTKWHFSLLSFLEIFRTEVGTELLVTYSQDWHHVDHKQLFSADESFSSFYFPCGYVLCSTSRVVSLSLKVIWERFGKDCSECLWSFNLCFLSPSLLWSGHSYPLFLTQMLTAPFCCTVLMWCAIVVLCDVV